MHSLRPQPQRLGRRSLPKEEAGVMESSYHRPIQLFASRKEKTIEIFCKLKPFSSVRQIYEIEESLEHTHGHKL
jgi:hypothetical protein